MKFAIRTILATFLAEEGAFAALNTFINYGVRVWRTSATEFELPGVSRTLVPLSPTGERVRFASPEAMQAVWGPDEGRYLIGGVQLDPGEEYLLSHREETPYFKSRTEIWTGRFLLVWGNTNGSLEVLVDLTANTLEARYEGQRGTINGYENAGGSPVMRPIRRILRRMYMDRRASLVAYETSAASKSWSPFDIEADHRPLWEESRGGIPWRLFEKYKIAEDRWLLKRWAQGPQGWERLWGEKPEGAEVLWAESLEAIRDGEYIAVAVPSGTVRLGPKAARAVRRAERERREREIVAAYMPPPPPRHTPFAGLADLLN